MPLYVTGMLAAPPLTMHSGFFAPPAMDSPSLLPFIAYANSPCAMVPLLLDLAGNLTRSVTDNGGHLPRIAPIHRLPARADSANPP